MNEEITYPEFTLRSYTKAELARLYMPGKSYRTAVRKFNYWIRYSPVLWNELVASGVTVSTRSYSPNQVRMIVNYLGVPSGHSVKKP